MNSATEENYLKVIYRLSQKGGGKVTPTAIADGMKVNAASVVDMLKKLVEKKLISYDKVRGAKLTEKGVRVSISIVRSHRLWEVFLLEKLGYSWEVVHEIAEQLEHVKHPELLEKLNKFLGYPEYDPHGDPIPKSGGEMPDTTKTLLSEIEIGRTCRVMGVKDTSTVFLQYLKELSINIGAKIKVTGKNAFDQSMTIQIGKGPGTMVSQKLAESLLVD
jgi:DtxR family Mn-dependent transcriptional regulator